MLLGHCNGHCIRHYKGHWVFVVGNMKWLTNLMRFREPEILICRDISEQHEFLSFDVDDSKVQEHMKLHCLMIVQGFVNVKKKLR